MDVTMTKESLPSCMAVLGSTGSVGKQALEVAKLHHIPISLLSAHTDTATLEQQAREFAPAVCALTDAAAAATLRTRLADTPIRVVAGMDALCDAIRELASPVVVNAILGQAGLCPTLAVLDTGCRLALANKESLVVAGALVMVRAKQTGAEIIPVDSEHSAIFQCLQAGPRKAVKRLLLTASGGPFFGYTAQQLRCVKLQDTLAHPTWKMGAKITVDSATMMNKGFEVIEASHLFGIPASSIEVLVHRESIIHSAVEYTDNAVIAQMSVPDMRFCVQYALTYPARVPGLTPPLDLTALGRLTFAHPDTALFPLLPLAVRAIGEGGGMPAVLNAANEVVVAAFLQERIGFTDIAETVSAAYETMSSAKSAVTLAQLQAVDSEARAAAERLLPRDHETRR